MKGGFKGLEGKLQVWGFGEGKSRPEPRGEGVEGRFRAGGGERKVPRWVWALESTSVGFAFPVSLSLFY